MKHKARSVAAIDRSKGYYNSTAKLIEVKGIITQLLGYEFFSLLKTLL
jgi:hypothetical protein